jgi:hypothetical protein
MDFTQRLRPGVLSGAITCSVRIWHSPRVKVGNRYESTGVGIIEIDSVKPMEWSEITPELARESGFSGIVDLLKIAKHGSGRNVYLVRFHRVKGAPAAKQKSLPSSKAPTGERQRKKVEKIVSELPGGETKALGRHMSLEVRGKRFGWFLVDHHGDGRVSINCKGTAEMHDILQQLAPAHFHVPKYGSRAWVGLWLDGPKLDWHAVELALGAAYEKTAPKKLLRT